MLSVCADTGGVSGECVSAVEAVWRVAVEGAPCRGDADDRGDVLGGASGECAVCGEPVPGGAGLPGLWVRDVVSKNFTEFDRFADPAGGVVCAPCGWAFTTSEWGRACVYAQTGSSGAGADAAAGGVVVRVGADMPWWRVHEVLSAQLAGDTAIAVPIRGRKHVLPWMRWGCVSTDGHTFEWGVSESVVHRAVWEVLAAGLKVGVLLDPSSPVVLPDALASAEGLQAWGVVSRWRGTPIVDVSARVFRECRREATSGGNE